jgi:hypothetical protein
VQTVLRLYYIIMDPAADDLLTASIGRSPRNDPEPPGPDQADFHGLPLDNATVPASTEARTRQYKDINSLLTFDSNPFDPSETRPIALQTSTLPDRNPDQTSGSAAAEQPRETVPDVLRRAPTDTPDTTRNLAVPASLQPPAEAPVELCHSHAQGSCRAPPEYHVLAHGAMLETAPSSDPKPSTAPPILSQADICAILESATRNPPAEAPMNLTLPHDPGYCRALPDYASGYYGAMPETAPSSDPRPATALPNSTQAALRSFSESATLNHPSQTSSRAEISVEAKPPSVSKLLRLWLRRLSVRKGPLARHCRYSADSSAPHLHHSRQIAPSFDWDR